MEYKKPVIIAQNNKNGSFAAGCPEKDGCNGGHSATFGGATIGAKCRSCERTK